MTLQILNAKQMNLPPCHYLIYGNAGSGKTTQAFSFPKPFGIISQAEPGLINLRGRDIPYVLVDTQEEMLEACDQALGLAKAGRVQTIVIDSLSVHFEHVVKQIEAARGGQMQKQDWGELSRHATSIPDYLREREIPVNVVYTAFAFADRDQNSGAMSGAPLFFGKTARRFPGKCEFEIYLESTVKPSLNGQTTSDPVYKAWFRSNGTFEAKCNIDVPMPASVTLDKGGLWPFIDKALRAGPTQGRMVRPATPVRANSPRNGGA